MLPKREYSFAEVTARLKEALGEPPDKDAPLVRALGLSSGDYSTRSRENRLPLDRVIGLCMDKGLDVAWVLTGRSSNVSATKHLAEEPAAAYAGSSYDVSPPATLTTNEGLMASVYEAIDRVSAEGSNKLEGIERATAVIRIHSVLMVATGSAEKMLTVHERSPDAVIHAARLVLDLRRGDR